MRLRDKSLAPADTEVEIKKLVQNFRPKADAILFLVVKHFTWIAEVKVLTSKS